MNGVPPTPRAIGFANPPNRPGPCVEFGCVGVEATCTVDFTGFRSERVDIAVPFSRLQARADILLRSGANDDRFDVEALFTLGAASNGINPLTEDVTLTLGPGSWTIPAGSFHRQPGGWFAFQGAVGATRLGVAIARLLGGRYSFGALGAGADLDGVVNPVPVGLRIGDDAGHTEILARIVP